MFRLYTGVKKQDETKDISYWQHKLIQVGCSEDLIMKLIQLKVIENYEHLYEVIKKYNGHAVFKEYKINNINEIWELLCLSGEPRAIQYAIEKEGLTAETKNKFGETGFHLACRSGCSDGIERSLLIRDINGNLIDPLVKTKADNTGFTCACWSGSSTAISKCLEAKNVKGDSIDPLDKTDREISGFHWACMSGSPLAIEKSLNVKNSQGESINFLDISLTGVTGFHYACMSGSLAAIKKSLEIKDSQGRRINPYYKTRSDGQTGLHLACKSGSLAAVIYLRHELNFDPMMKDEHGNDAFWYAEQSDNASLVKEALLAPLSTIDLESNEAHQEPPYKKYKLSK
jgi:ankyrin repeat protein